MFTFYYGKDCPHCAKMHELLDATEKKQGKLFDRVEVWHNEEELKKLEAIDKDRCGGVPFFYNPKTDTYLCGEIEEGELETWLKEQEM